MAVHVVHTSKVNIDYQSSSYDNLLHHTVLVAMSRSPHNPHGIKPVDLEDIWGDLSKGIRRIYSRQSMPKKRYMELYTYPLRYMCTLTESFDRFSAS